MSTLRERPDRLRSKLNFLSDRTFWTRFESRALRYLVIVMILGAIPAVIYIPRWQVNHLWSVRQNDIKWFELANEARKTDSQIVLSMFGLIVLYMTWRRTKAADKTVAIAEQGHITDRYTKAIEQLGKMDGDKPNIEVRLGAIYALERIALDSERDFGTVLEVLTAYVRRNAPLLVSEKQEERSDEKDGKTDMDTLPSPRTDVQAILSILGKQEIAKRCQAKSLRLNLAKTDLRKADLSNGCLFEIDLRESNLEGANLTRANLRGSNLGRAQLSMAVLSEANLEGAFMVRANLSCAKLNYAYMKGALLIYASAVHAELFGAHLEEANLWSANLECAAICGSQLNQANLAHANLREAYLEGANLEGAYIRETHLQKAYLQTEQVKIAKSWEFAYYDPEFRDQLGMVKDIHSEKR